MASGAAGLFAQDPKLADRRFKGEISGSLGLGRFYHGDDFLGSGLDVAAGFGIRPFEGMLRGLGFELLFTRFSFRNEWGDGYSNIGSVRTVTGNALYHFGRSRHQFYLVGGLGALKADYTSVNGYMKNVLNDPGYSRRIKADKLVRNLGVGAKLRIGSRFALRPEIRLFDTTIGKGYNWAHFRPSMGISYHFW